MSAEPTSLSDINRELDAIDRQDSVPSEERINREIEAIESNQSPESQPETETQIDQSTSPPTSAPTEEPSKAKSPIEPEVPVIPKPTRCTHANRIKKKIKRFGRVECNKCKTPNPTDRLVFCLICHKLGCSRQSEQQHALKHHQGSQHNLCLTIPTYEEYNEYSKDILLDMMTIWCYKCDLFLHETEQDNTKKIKDIKYEVFGCLQRGYKRLVCYLSL